MSQLYDCSKHPRRIPTVEKEHHLQDQQWLLDTLSWILTNTSTSGTSNPSLRATWIHNHDQRLERLPQPLQLGLPPHFGQPLHRVRQPCYRSSHQHTGGAMAACKEDSGWQQLCHWRSAGVYLGRRFRGTSGTSQILNTFNAVYVCLKGVYENWYNIEVRTVFNINKTNLTLIWFIEHHNWCTNSITLILWFEK